MESPSGRECEESTNRCRARIASTICRISGLVVIILRSAGSAAGRRLGGANLVEELLDPVLAGNRFVVDELELRDALQPQPRSNLPPQKRHGALERARRAPAFLFVAKRGVVHARLLQIRRQLDAGHGHEADAGITHLPRQQDRELAADLVGDAIGTGALRHHEFGIWNNLESGIWNGY